MRQSDRPDLYRKPSMCRTGMHKLVPYVSTDSLLKLFRCEFCNHIEGTARLTPPDFTSPPPVEYALDDTDLEELRPITHAPPAFTGPSVDWGDWPPSVDNLEHDGEVIDLDSTPPRVTPFTALEHDRWERSDEPTQEVPYGPANPPPRVGDSTPPHQASFRRPSGTGFRAPSAGRAEKVKRRRDL